MDHESLFSLDPPSGPPVSSIVDATDRRGGLLHANIAGATDPLVLNEYCVRLVVQCAAELSGRVQDVATFAESIAGHVAGFITVLDVPMDDDDVFDIGPALSVALPEIARTRASGGTVLVNCAAGRSRSAAVIIAHLMDSDSKAGPDGAPFTLAKAWGLLRSKRLFAYPNLGFTVQLMAREQEVSITPDLLRLHYGYRLLFDDDAEGQAWVSGKMAIVRQRLLRLEAAGKLAAATGSST